jgi:outer membrane protein
MIKNSRIGWNPKENIMKQVVTICMLALFFALASSAFAADEAKLGSVDVQKILMLSDAGKEARGKLETKAKKIESEKNSREVELNKLKTELEKQGALLSEKERSVKEKAYEQRLQEYQQFFNKAKEDFQAEDTELTKRIAGNIIKIVQDYGRKKGYLFIFVKNDSMIYLDEKVDLTDEILQAIHASEKTGPGVSGS